MDVTNKRVLVVGLGKSGLAAVRLLAGRGANVIVNDLRDADALGPIADEARSYGAELALGHHDAALFSSVDQIVVSPGVPPLHALTVAEEKGIPIASEIELASWFIQAPILGITGTNGKSTVTTLLGLMAEHSGRPTFVGGNLGTPLVDVIGTDAAGPNGLVVVELSSFQLERVAQLRVHVGALLNVTPDHLDRYATLDEYAAAKARIFERQTEQDFAIVPFGDALCLNYAQAGRAKLLKFGGSGGDVRVVQGVITDATNGLAVPLSQTRLVGAHNADNACAAALMARASGIEVTAIAQALLEFAPLGHRMQRVRELNGVQFFDDSKATNVGATVAALDGLDRAGGRVVLIAGGKHKGAEYTPIRERLDRFGRAAVLIGEATPLLEGDFEGARFVVERATTMADAVQRAFRLAQPGDLVLLAPACSSFDMFRSYAHRGDEFQAAARALTEADHGAR